MMRPIARACVCTAVVAGVLGLSGGAAAAGSVPPGFTDSPVTGVVTPTALAFTPDGRMLITTQAGALRVYASGMLVPTPALNLSVCTGSEQGLLGVAVDPAFGVGANRTIYLYYSAPIGGGNCVNRVSRFTLSDANTATPIGGPLIDNIRSRTNHNGGDLNFGKDGYLYVSVGDGGSGSDARVQSHLLGKILRITGDGGIPPDNPFRSAATGRCNATGSTSAAQCQETFAWGLRNPFRFAFDPNAAGTRFFINDVGLGAWEEIDVGQAGADYGWNIREGPCVIGSTTNCGSPPAGMTNPIFAYPHTTGCTVITGGAFVPNGVWPAEYDGDYLYSDFECDKIGRLEPSGSPAAPDFATGLNRAVHLRFGPWAGPFGQTQALYYTTYASGGQIRRVGYTAGPPRVPQPPPSPPPGGPGSPGSPGTPPPPPGTTPTGTPAVRITAIRYDAPGVDGRAARSLNGEWIRLRNFAGRPVALRGWTIRDAQGHVYRFGGYTLAAGSAVTIHTGPGRNTAAHRYWRRARHVWGNTRDRATLRAASGAVADVCRYANRRANLKRC